MANSLIELYGGGMARKSNNYQLGGRIASSKRQSEYQGEVRKLRQAAEEAAKKQQRASALGNVLSTVGSIAGSFIPGVGTAIGAGLGAGAGRWLGESTYKSTDFGEGKYAKQSRSDLKGMSEDYKKSMGERALAEGVRTAASAYFKPKLIEGTKDFIAREGLFKMPVDPGGRFAKKVTKEGFKDNPFLKAQQGMTEEQINEQFWDEVPFAAPTRPDVPFSPETIGIMEDVSMPALEQGIFDLEPSLFDDYDAYRMSGGYGPFQNRGGGLIDYTIPKMQYGGRVGTEYDPTRPQQQQTNPYGQQIFGSNNPVFGPGTDWSMTGSNVFGLQNAGAQVSNPEAETPTGRGINVGYGTATDVGGALAQMGMGNIMNDPRFAQYASDLPQFGMGYAQQVGDIYTGGKQATRAIRGGARTAAGQRGFGRSGIGSQQLESSMTNLYTDIDRKRRGVVEGYQADLLSAIGDIERKGEFEFDRDAKASVSTPPPGLTAIMNQNPNMSLAAAEEQYEQEMQDYYDQQYG